MSDIGGELARVREAFDRPTLQLVRPKWAPLILAVFRSSFGGNRRRAIPVERLHVHVQAFLDELRGVGEEVPDQTGRSLCLQWMHARWLYRDTGPGGDEQYSLTSHALEALSLIDSLSRDRALISESRLSMILADVHKWAAEANPDRNARIAELDSKISELTAERDRLAAGGDLVAASEERMLDGYANLVDLISQLPGDFARVDEAMAVMHRSIVENFRAEERPIGSVIDEYLDRTDRLMTDTAEGRAFEGAFALLRDDALLTGLNRDLRTIVAHPFSEVLTPGERRAFIGTVKVLSDGIDDVLTQRSRLTTTLRDHIIHHDLGQSRELDDLLREIERETGTWMHNARARTRVDVDLLPPPRAELEHLQERFYDTAADIPPPPLRDHSAHMPATVSLAEVRQQGGPQLDVLTAALRAAAADGAKSLGSVFAALDSDLRRPVEILGLLHLATGIGALSRAEGAESFLAVRPDGTTRTFTAPRIPLAPHDADALDDRDPA